MDVLVKTLDAIQLDKHKHTLLNFIVNCPLEQLGFLLCGEVMLSCTTC